MYKKIVGIYEIRNTVNGHRYIGSSCSVSRRWNEHKRRLHNGEHHSVYLQRAWDLYGEAAFTFEVLCPATDRDSCIVIEQEYLDKYRPEYNMAPRAISPGGFIISDATREKHRKNSLRLMQNKDRFDKAVSALRKGQLAAAKWHRSGEGREWAKKNYETSLALTHVDHDLICIQCGKEYQGEKGKFCSDNCQSKWRREHGADDVTRTCTVCGNEFVINKYSHTLTCSKSCSQSRWIIQFDRQGNLINKFKNAFDARKQTGIDNSIISRCCKGTYKSAGGFIWRYAEAGQ